MHRPPGGARIVQPGVDSDAALRAIADELVLPTLVVHDLLLDGRPVPITGAADLQVGDPLE